MWCDCQNCGGLGEMWYGCQNRGSLGDCGIAFKFVVVWINLLQLFNLFV